MSTKKLGLKAWVDGEVKWAKPGEKVAAIIELEFTQSGVKYRRMGMDGKRGWHYLE